MEIIHHVGFNTSSKQALFDAIIELGIKHKINDLPAKGGRLVTFDISETDPSWPAIIQLLKKYIGLDIYRGGDMYETFFSEQDIRKAEWSRLVSTFEQGYPYPKGNWPFKQLSLVNVCPACGIYEQNNSMRFYKEPGLHKNSFMNLIGGGEIFAVPEVFSALEKIGAKGYKSWEVIINKTKQSSERVLQIYPPWITTHGLIDTDSMRQVICPTCGITKYYYHAKGVMRIKKESLIPDTDFMRTNEWFGVGLVAFREILVSNRVAQLILDKGWKGIQLKVVEFE
jgi:hypothetical protein